MKDITVEQVIALLPKKVTLHFVDRNDSLDDHTKTIQKCITKGSLDELYQQIDEWYIDDYYGFELVADELKSDIETAFDLDEYDAELVHDKYEDEISTAIYERDDSDVVKDLFRNTSDYVFFYDTGHYVECDYPCSAEEYIEQLEQIKDIIKLCSNDYDELILQMMYQASYAGNLVIYFRANGFDVLKSIEDGCNVIHFSGEVNIAIPNHSQGAGDHTSFKHSFSLPFSKDNLFLCKEVKYSYTYEVCGMYSNWCDSTDMKLSTSEEDLGSPEVSDVSIYMVREAKLDKVYKDGGCTSGDTNFSRHRDVQYHNEPMYCRNECPHCHTTWLD